jgi:hypothetical protein
MAIFFVFINFFSKNKKKTLKLTVLPQAEAKESLLFRLLPLHCASDKTVNFNVLPSIKHY